MERNTRSRPLTDRQRRWLHAQGFGAVADDYLAEVGPWLRFAPAVCLVWVAVATLAGSAPAFWALAPFAAAGAILRGHPFDVVYNHALRHLAGTRPLPPYGRPRRFACAVATAWIVAIAATLQAGAAGVGTGLAVIFLAAPLVNLTTGFCVPSWIYGRVFGAPTASAARRAPAAAR
jgi:hypothetical protein